MLCLITMQILETECTMLIDKNIIFELLNLILFMQEEKFFLMKNGHQSQLITDILPTLVDNFTPKMTKKPLSSTCLVLDWDINCLNTSRLIVTIIAFLSETLKQRKM